MKNNIIFKQTPLYRFLEYCQNENKTERSSVLDCGAGGNLPPLSLFCSHGMATYGIDFDEKQVERAKLFAYEMNQYNVHTCQDTKLNFLVMNSFREFYATA